MKYADIYQMGNLWLAWSKLQRKSKTAPGIDGMRIQDFQRQADRFLRRLQNQLEQGTYQPMGLKVIRVPKGTATHEKRTLVIPTLRDRVVQHAVLNVILPGLDKQLTRACFAYRPGLSVLKALQQIQVYQAQGLNSVIRLDIQAFFDSVSHCILQAELNTVIPEQGIRDLLELWLEQSLYTPYGLPQGAVISPLLANLYLHPFDRALQALGVKVVRYADDLVILCHNKDEANACLESAKQMLAERELCLHPDKTYLTDFDKGFDFLGARFEQQQLLLPEWLTEQRTQTPPPKPAQIPQATQRPNTLLPETAYLSATGYEAAASHSAEVSTDWAEALSRTLYIQEQGSRLHLEAGRLKMTKVSQVILSLPAEQVQRIVILGVCGITPAVIRYCLKRQVSIFHLSRQGHYLGETTAYVPQRVKRHQLQFDSQHSPKHLRFAQQFVSGKLHNCRLLLRYLSTQQDIDLKFENERLKAYQNKALQTADIQSLLGYEGLGSRLYFTALQKWIPAVWGFEGRKRQPPPDPVNAMLSLAYTLLYQRLHSWILVHHLHPEVGYLHALSNGHAALASDLMEEFRAPIVDFCVLQILQSSELTPADFISDPQRGCRMNPQGLKCLLNRFEKRMQTWVRHAPSGKRVSLERCLELQVIQMLACLEGRKHQYEPYAPANW